MSTSSIVRSQGLITGSGSKRDRATAMSTLADRASAAYFRSVPCLDSLSMDQLAIQVAGPWSRVVTNVYVELVNPERARARTTIDLAPKAHYRYRFDLEETRGERENGCILAMVGSMIGPDPNSDSHRQGASCLWMLEYAGPAPCLTVVRNPTTPDMVHCGAYLAAEVMIAEERRGNLTLGEIIAALKARSLFDFDFLGVSVYQPSFHGSRDWISQTFATCENSHMLEPTLRGLRYRPNYGPYSEDLVMPQSNLWDFLLFAYTPLNASVACDYFGPPIMGRFTAPGGEERRVVVAKSLPYPIQTRQAGISDNRAAGYTGPRGP